MTTQKERIAALEQRVDVLEQRMEAPAKTQHYGKTTYLRTPVQNTAELAPLKELTAVEEAFLKERGLNSQQRNLSFQLQAKQLTEQDKMIIQTLRTKRACQITYFN